MGRGSHIMWLFFRAGASARLRSVASLTIIPKTSQVGSSEFHALRSKFVTKTAYQIASNSIHVLTTTTTDDLRTARACQPKNVLDQSRQRGRQSLTYRASSTRLNGVSAQRSRDEKPASSTMISRSRFCPACAPKATPVSCASEVGTQTIVEAL